MLRNPIYNGWVRRGRRSHVIQEVEAPWRLNPRVSDALWEQVQTVRARRERGGGMHRPKTVDVLGGLLYCVCGRYVRSDGFTGSGTRQRHHPEPCEAWGAKARRAARVWEEPISSQLASISLDDATIARITTALASPTKPVSDIDARRLGRRKRELAWRMRTGA
ncbi:MAG: hypothetical protein H0V89_00085 [Deltaproteobacteria bacterium]|nr:hypothetical protein [Deltaproteobacteria bacterium]